MNAVTILESDWNKTLETVKVLDAKVNAIAALLTDLKFPQSHAGEDPLSGVIRFLIKRREETTPFFTDHGKQSIGGGTYAGSPCSASQMSGIGSLIGQMNDVRNSIRT